MKRRTFIKNTVAATTMAAAAPQMLSGMQVRANSPYKQLSGIVDDDRILIIIQMFGGNDGLNTVVPVADDYYYTLRPTLAVPKKDAWQWVPSDMYFHPALVKNQYQNGLGGLMDKGWLAVIQDIGYEDPNLSHFRSTDIWLSGINSSDPYVRLDEGWVSRYLTNALPDFPETLPEHPLCVQIGGTLSMLFQSQKGDTGIALTDPQAFFDSGNGLSPDEAMLTDKTAYAEEFNYVRSIAMQSDVYSKVVLNAYKAGAAKRKVTYPTTGLGAQMGIVSNLISGGLKSKVFLLNMGGFDTHVQQQDADDVTKGNHPGLLSQLANSIALFMDDALKQGFSNRVVGLTVSEFGRRPYENGSRGTDHGSSSVQFIFGDEASIRSSRYGHAPNLKDVDKNGDIVAQHDFRRIYFDVLENWFGASHDDAKKIMGSDFAPLGIFKKRVSSVRDVFQGQGDNAVEIYPNPSIGDSYISFELSRPCNVQVKLYDALGKYHSTLHSGWLIPGNYKFAAQNMRSGAYICYVQAGEQTIQKPFVVMQ